MKRLCSSDSLIPICPSGEEPGMYGCGFPSSMMDAIDDEDYCGEDELLSSAAGGRIGGGSGGEKKRRLSVEQVRALEKNFEVENKLEPERKARLAQELGLQPRQVAVWFQNRRARWKTKQLERDYGALKNSYDSLRQDYDSLRRDKDALLAQIKELKAKLGEEERGSLSFSSVKEEPMISESENNKACAIETEDPPRLIYKDGSSDSDSSAVLNEETKTTAVERATVPAIIAFESSPLSFLGSSASNSSSAMAMDLRVHKGVFFYGQNPQNPLKMEDDEFLGGDEPCSRFFNEEQPPSLSWCYSSAEQWS